MNNRFIRLARLSWIEFKQRIMTLRMGVLTPLLVLFILGACWGLSDPDVELPSDIEANQPYEVLYLVSLFVLLSATLGVVLVGFDGISRKRLSGELAIELAQPISRKDLGLSLLLGTWLTVAIPTLLISLLGIVMIERQLGQWPSIGEAGLFLLATGLVLFWYASLQLLASSLARDMGSAIALGLGTWMLFTMIWLLVTVVLATFMGVDATDTSNSTFDAFAAKVDLFSPNGAYHLLLETLIEEDLGRPVNTGWVIFSVLGWTLLPLAAFLWKFDRLKV